MASGSVFPTSVDLARFPTLSALSGLVDFAFARSGLVEFAFVLSGLVEFAFVLSGLVDFAFARTGLVDFAGRVRFDAFAPSGDTDDRDSEGLRAFGDGSDCCGLTNLPLGDRRAVRAVAVTVAVAIAVAAAP